MNARPKKTAAQRKVARWGTKRHAMYEISTALRRYAKARRARHWSGDDGTRYESDSSHGMVLGAMHALYRCGVITQAQMHCADHRLERVMRAKITRRPLRLVKEAA